MHAYRKRFTRGRWLRVVLTALLLVSLGSAISSGGQAPRGLPAGAPLDSADSGVRAAADPIPGQYIVVYREDTFGREARRSAGRLRASVRSMNASMARRWGAQVRAEWSRAVRGMAATMSPKAAAALARDPRVLLVEQDGRVYASAIQSPATWGLDRVDQRNQPLSDSYRYDVDGSGVTAYILDTGIRVTHQEFGGRAEWGTNATGDGLDLDCDGHGTHVAGTVGGTTYGVAKDIELVAIKVLDCNGEGTDSGVISGIDWMIANQADAGNPPAVANMSLGGGYSDALNLAIQSATEAGITMVAAAGNEDADACSYSPGAAPEALTVGAVTSTDTRSDFSNYGECVDLFAPGSAITSSTSDSDTAIGTWSGTSMAAPHVAGGAALHLDAVYLATGEVLPPADVAAHLTANATPDKVVEPAGSPNRLLYTLDDGIIQLTVAKTGTGSGTVTSQAAGIDCGSDCTERYDDAPGTFVTLEAFPADGDVFDGWSGGDCAGIGPCSLTMDASKSVTATFTTPPPMVGNGETLDGLSGETGAMQYYAVQVPDGAVDLIIATSGGTGDVDLYVRYGTPPTLSAFDCRPYFWGNDEVCASFPTPQPGTWYVMLHGYEAFADVSLSVSYTEPVTLYGLTITKSGDGDGVVSSSPEGIACGTACSMDFPADSIVTLSAKPDVDASFAGWSGACTGVDPCEVVLTQDLAITATFEQEPLPDDMVLQNTSVDDPSSYQARRTITVGPSLSVAATGDLRLYAGESISFRSGFSVQAGGRLSAEIDPALRP